MAEPLDLEVVIVSHGAEELLRRCLRSLAASTRASGAMRVTVVDSGSPDATPDMVEREFPAGAAAPPRQHRLLGRQQPRPARERGRGRAAAQPRHRGLRGHARRGAGAAALRPADRHGRGQAGDRVGRARPRLQALLPHPAQRPRPLHRDRPREGAADRSASTGRPTSATTSRARSTRSTAPSCSAAPRRCARSACSTRATGSTWRTSTGAAASGTRAGRSSTSRPASPCTSRAAPAARRRAPKQEIAFHRGMGRFYRRFDAPEHNPLLNAAVYAGIGAKLAVSLAITAVKGRGRPKVNGPLKRQDPPKRVESGEAGNHPAGD